MAKTGQPVVGVPAPLLSFEAMTMQGALERKQMIAAAMWTVACAASAPLVVQQGSIPAAYGSTHVLGVPLVFVIAGVVVGLLSVGYVAMARAVRHPAVYYAAMSRGLGRPVGVGAGMVALLAYNTIQTSLYGFVGWQLADVFGGQWWIWALVVVPVVAVFGMRGITRLTAALAVVLVLSLLMVLLFNLAALANPAAGLTLDAFQASSLTGGVGGAFAYAIASFMGFEAAATFSEEARSRHAPGKAVGAALTFLVICYALTAWTTSVAAGAGEVTNTPIDPMAVFDEQFGPLMPPVVRLVLILAVIASMIALHSICARYAFAMSREGVLPIWMQSTGSGTRTGAPVAGSLAQSGVAVLVILAFAVLGTDPLASLFAYFSTLGALSLLLLLLLTSVAALRYLRTNGPDPVGVWVHSVAPVLGLCGGVVVAALMIFNVDALLGTGPGSTAPALILLAVVIVFLGGLTWGLVLRNRIGYEQIGYGTPDKYSMVNDRLSKFEL